MSRTQRPNETLQEYMYLFIELMKILTGLEPQQISDPLKIDLFNRHLFNQEIKKSVSKSTHRNLKEAFDAATNAEKRAKRFEGLSDNDAAIMTVKVDKHKVNQITADTKNQHHTVTQVSSAPNAKPYDPTHYYRKMKSDNNCYKCGKRGHYA